MCVCSELKFYFNLGIHIKKGKNMTNYRLRIKINRLTKLKT